MSGVRAYLDPTAPIAPAALLTDDPKGAMDLAVALTDSPRMSNLAHGLWGYHGTTSEGLELTIQALGIGGPSAYIVVSDLARLGVKRVIRIGSCMSLGHERALGSAVVASMVEPCDGVGRAVCGKARIEPDEALTRALAASLADGASAAVRSVDLLEEQASDLDGPQVLDLSSAAVAGAAARGGVGWACALIVGETLGGAEMAREELEAALLALGRGAGAALSDVSQPSAP
jgi:hypothetical protein